MAEQQKVLIEIPEGYSAEERRGIALEIIQRIVDRTRDEGRDKNGRPFAGYSESYKNSLEFKIAGKTSAVDLTLSSEMLDALKMISQQDGALEIGYDGRNKKLNGKVEGNRLGTYGNNKQVAPKRDFLGITKKDLTKILKNYPLKNAEKRAENIKNLRKAGVSEE